MYSYEDRLRAVRLVGAILLEQTDEWVVQRARYMPRDTLKKSGTRLAQRNGYLHEDAPGRPYRERGGDRSPVVWFAFRLESGFLDAVVHQEIPDGRTALRLWRKGAFGAETLVAGTVSHAWAVLEQFADPVDEYAHLG